MKHFLIATLFVFTVLTGCKDDTPVDTGVRKLISLATSPDNLAAMPSNYAGWL